jgi:hypothetical protein
MDTYVPVLFLELFRVYWYSLKIFIIYKGVLGNKCAGQHNLKTVYIKEAIVSGYFFAWSSAIHVCVFLQRSIYHRSARASSSVAMVGVTPYKLSLKVPWVNKQLVRSDFTLRKRQKATGAKYSE